MRPVGNLRPRWRTHGAGVLALALAALVAAAGITVPSALDVRSREAQVAAARERVAFLRAECERVETLRARAGLGARDGASEPGANRLPAALSSIEAFSAVRMAARDAGVAIETLTAGETVEVGGASVRMRSLSVTGEATTSDLVELPVRLRAEGYPSAVLELSLARERAGVERFRFELELGLFFEGHDER